MFICIVLIPMSVVFECGANWDHYTDIDDLLRPISISWAVVSTLVLVLPLIDVMIERMAIFVKMHVHLPLLVEQLYLISTVGLCADIL